MIVYFNNRFLPQSPDDSLPNADVFFMDKSVVRISPDDRGFTFGDGIYEVIKAYRGKIFTIDEHTSRLDRSLAAIRLPAWDTGSLVPVLGSLLRANGLDKSDTKIYIQITRGIAPRDHAFPPENTPLTIFISAEAISSKKELMEQGVAAITTTDYRWQRCDIKQIGLIANVLANQEAHAAGAHEALFVRDGRITEGSHTNFCALIAGVLHTHPANNLILPGITRTIVIDLCRKLDLPVIEQPVDLERLWEVLEKPDTECFILGTTTEIMPLVKIDDRPVGNGRPGPVTRRIQQAFNELTAKL